MAPPNIACWVGKGVGGGGGGSETRVTATVLKQDPNTTRFKSDQPNISLPLI